MPAPVGVRVRLVTGPAGELRWRLLAGNGRVLAVSATEVGGAAEAEAALVEIVTSADEVVASIKHPESSVRWAWTGIDASGTPIATGERPYERYGTCVSSFARFRATITELTDSDVRVLFARLVPDGKR